MEEARHVSMNRRFARIPHCRKNKTRRNWSQVWIPGLSGKLANISLREDLGQHRIEERIQIKSLLPPPTFFPRSLSKLHTEKWNFADVSFRRSSRKSVLDLRFSYTFVNQHGKQTSDAKQRYTIVLVNTALRLISLESSSTIVSTQFANRKLLKNRK